jgi:hypothetical protein
MGVTIRRPREEFEDIALATYRSEPGAALLRRSRQRRGGCSWSRGLTRSRQAAFCSKTCQRLISENARRQLFRKYASGSCSDTARNDLSPEDGFLGLPILRKREVRPRNPRFRAIIAATFRKMRATNWDLATICIANASFKAIPEGTTRIFRSHLSLREQWFAQIPSFGCGDANWAHNFGRADDSGYARFRKIIGLQRAFSENCLMGFVLLADYASKST